MSNELEKFLETIFLQLKNNMMIVKGNFSIFTKPTEKGHETNSDRAIASIKRAVSWLGKSFNSVLQQIKVSLLAKD